MDEYYPGARKTIWLFPGAEASWADAELGVPSSKEACKANFRAHIAFVADQPIPPFPSFLRSEGSGCYAIKARCGLRAWGWMQHYKGRAAFVISHVVLKKKDKADPADLQRTIDAKRRIEELMK